MLGDLHAAHAELSDIALKPHYAKFDPAKSFDFKFQFFSWRGKATASVFCAH